MKMVRTGGHPKTGRWLVMVASALAFALASVQPGRAAAEDSAPSLLEKARRAFEGRDRRGESLRSVELYKRAIESGAGYEACWEGARAAFHHGYFTLQRRPRSKRLAVLKQGSAWAKRATEIRPNGAEGHFYCAALLGVWGETKGMATAIFVARQIRREAEKALELDREVECAGALRLLGRYYFRLPAAFGGSREKSLKLLEEARERCPTHPQTYTYLADVLVSLGKNDRARKLCEWVLSNPSPGREHKRFRADAAQILKAMQ